ncbi:MAG: DUF4369 domain-containing protein, partial [Myxococcaceae bacterium]
MSMPPGRGCPPASSSQAGTRVSWTAFGLLKGRLAEPGLYELKLDTMAMTYPIFIEGSAMQINIQNEQVYQVKGSKLHDQYEQYTSGFIDPIRNELIRLFEERSRAQQKGDTVLYNKLLHVNDSIS